MNIGFDASRAFTKNKTGTENYSYQILKHLAKIDHTNKYYIYLRPTEKKERGVAGAACPPVPGFGRREDPQRVPASALGGRTSVEGKARQDPERELSWPPNFKFITIPYPRLWTQVGLSLQTFKDPLNVLFIPAHTLPLIRKPGLKTVVTVHDLGAEYLPKTHQLKQRLYLRLMTRYQLKSATHLIAVSQSTKNDLIKKVGIAEKNISVVYEGFNQELFTPIDSDTLDSILKEYDLVKKGYFLFVGTIQPRKNLARLIRAYASYLNKTGDGKRGAPLSARNEVRTSNGAASRQDPFGKPTLVLAGSKGWLSDEIYELPKKLGIEDRVKFLGYVPDEQLPALYCGAKAFLYPSLYEGFGLPILEAFCCGCPVLTSTTSSIPEVAGKAAILVDPYSIEEIAQGILKIERGELRMEKIKAGYKQVKKFSWKKASWQTLKLLTKTV